MAGLPLVHTDISIGAVDFHTTEWAHSRVLRQLYKEALLKLSKPPCRKFKIHQLYADFIPWNTVARIRSQCMSSQTHPFISKSMDSLNHVKHMD